MDQNIEAVPAVDDFLDDLSKVVGVSGVEAAKHELRAVFLMAGAREAQLIGIDVGGADLCAGLAESTGYSPAEALGCPGYQRYFAI